MRLFIAVNFSDEIKNRILEVQEVLRSQSTRGSFTRPENLHLTLAFLGETPEEKLNSLRAIIDDIKSPSFEVPFNRTGCFTHSRKELWWIGADKDCQGQSPGLSLLKSIHERLIRDLLDAGFSVDERPFNAHVTLAREVKHINPIVLACPEMILKVNRVSLMKSERLEKVLTYTELMGRDLTRD
jgi:2'-5' RNA ligase